MDCGERPLADAEVDSVIALFAASCDPETASRVRERVRSLPEDTVTESLIHQFVAEACSAEFGAAAVEAAAVRSDSEFIPY